MILAAIIGSVLAVAGSRAMDRWHRRRAAGALVGRLADEHPCSPEAARRRLAAERARHALPPSPSPAGFVAFAEYLEPARPPWYREVPMPRPPDARKD